MQTKTTSYLARAAMTLLLATLSSTGAWADKTYTAQGQEITDHVTWNNETVIVQGSGSITFKDNATIEIKGKVTLKVASGVTLNADAGIYVEYGNSLTIEGSGTINATGNGGNAAIGGISTRPNPGTIIINGCTITATVNSITGTDNSAGAAIGGGHEPTQNIGGNAGTIIINGGNVTANGGRYSAGIGCGDRGEGGSVTINGGTVTAQSSGSNTGGAAIGSGRYGSINDITINGGTVTATSRPYSAGIGGGQYGGCGTINIYGGNVKSENHDGVYSYYSFGPGKDYDSSSGTCTVTFGWTNSTDKIEGCQFSSNNNKTLVFVKGKQFINDNYSVVETAANFSLSSDFSLTPRIVDNAHDIANAALTGHSTYTENNFVYTGSDIAYGVKIGTTALTAGTNYTVDKLTCNGTDVTALNAKGDYELTILGTGDYCGIKTFQFTVNDEVILSSSNKVTSWVDGTTYIASDWVPMISSGDITVTGNVHLLILGDANYPLSTSSINVSAGNTLTISGNGYLAIDVSSNKVVLGNDNGNCGTIIINGGNINCISSSYDGLIGSNNTDAGTVEINGGVIQAREIRCKDINYNGGQVTISKRNYAGYGYIACANLTLGWTDAENDFIQAYAYSPTNLAFVPGKAFMVDGEYTTVTASNINSLGTKKLVPKTTDMSKDIAYATISGINATYEYTGSAIDISGYTVTDTDGNTLTRDDAYSAALTLGGTAVSEVKDAGNYVLTVTGQNGYTGEKSVNFTVTVSAPTSLKQTAYSATTATLSWTEASTPTNWTLEYSTDETFATGVTSMDVTSKPVTLTDLNKDATYYARVKIVSGSVESGWSNTAEFGTTAKRWIGFGYDDKGSSYYPLYANTASYSLSEQIYLKKEIGGAGIIRSIDYFVTQGSGTRNIDIYMVHTDETQFASTNPTWINPTSTDLVYSEEVSGEVTFAVGWNTITLTTPFEYNGTQNLAIIVNDKTGGKTGTLAFRTYQVSNVHSIRTTGNSVFNPLNYNGSASSTDKLNCKIRLGMYESVAMNADGIRTYASPFALDLSSVNAYVVSDFNGTNSTLTLTKVNTAPANTGLMLKTSDDSQKGQSIDLPILSSASAIETNYLVGVNEDTAIDVHDGDYTNFVLAKVNDKINWHILSGPGTLTAHKAYLRLPTSGIGDTSTSRSFTWVYEDATGINDVQRSTPTVERDTWFSLDGVKLNGKPMTKGLYINNGKKVVVR